MGRDVGRDCWKDQYRSGGKSMFSYPRLGFYQRNCSGTLLIIIYYWGVRYPNTKGVENRIPASPAEALCARWQDVLGWVTLWDAIQFATTNTTRRIGSGPTPCSRRLGLCSSSPKTAYAIPPGPTTNARAPSVQERVSKEVYRPRARG
jgi:hypothetical protein